DAVHQLARILHDTRTRRAFVTNTRVRPKVGILVRQLTADGGRQRDGEGDAERSRCLQSWVRHGEKHGGDSATDDREACDLSRDFDGTPHAPDDATMSLMPGTNRVDSARPGV